MLDEINNRLVEGEKVFTVVHNRKEGNASFSFVRSWKEAVIGKLVYGKGSRADDGNFEVEILGSEGTEGLEVYAQAIQGCLECEILKEWRDYGEDDKLRCDGSIPHEEDPYELFTAQTNKTGMLVSFGWRLDYARNREISSPCNVQQKLRELVSRREKSSRIGSLIRGFLGLFK